MTKDEALRMALEALEVASSCVDGYYIPIGKSHLPEVEQAITAIKEALAQEQEPVAWLLEGINVVEFDRQPYHDGPEWTPLYTTPPAQQEHEPVAVKHMMEWVEYLKRQSDHGQHLHIPSGMSAGTCWELAIELEQFISTTPPQRKPLTDEQIQKCYETTGHYQTLRSQDGFAVFALARAIEAAHGIKE